MAVILEMPLQHPSRRPNPFRLRTPSTWGVICPECDESFDGQAKLYLHLLKHHPDQLNKQKTT